MWRAAIQRFESVPTPDKGGRPDEYLEARIRTAHLSFSHFNQFTKARNILESLRLTYGDPSIDAYLGEIYFRLALYEESIERLERALESPKGSVIPFDELKKESYYYLASALDGKYTFLQQTEESLGRVRVAWNQYIEKYTCSENEDEKACAFAVKRADELKEVE